jgi:hypothetical protein
LAEQATKLTEQATKLTEQDTQIAELKRHLEEWDHKFGDLTVELSRAREESGAIAEAGTSHDVEGRVARNVLPLGSDEAEGQVSQKKRRTVKVVGIDVTDPRKRKGGERICKMKRTATSDVSRVDILRKRKL